MDKYAEYLDDADEASGDSIKMMREAMAHTQVRKKVLPSISCEPRVSWNTHLPLRHRHHTPARTFPE